jgi:predicted transcriptional regulator
METHPLEDETTTNPIETTTQIVSAYVSRHPAAVSELPSLIRNVYAAMQAGSEPAASLVDPVKLTAAQM